MEKYMQSSDQMGLSSKEAAQLLDQYGFNSVAFEATTSPLIKFFHTFTSPLILLLIVSSSVSAYFGDTRSFITIVVMVLLSSLLDFYNTYKSDKAAQKLKDRVRISAAVIRDKEEQEIPIEKIVPGDLVVVKVGGVIPADGEVVQDKHCFTNESALTGESFPVAKSIGSQVYMGSSVTTGEAIMKVTATGGRTRFNHIVANLSKKEQLTEFDREIQSFSVLIIKVTVLLMIFVFGVNAIFKNELLGALLFAVALAVGMAPEMMPMIITINLSKGSLAMAKRGVIVKRLSSIQNFGSLDLLCTDKTGTLTEDSIALVRYVDAYGKESEDVLRYGYLNSSYSDGFRNPLDDAILAYKHLSRKGYSKLDEIPFDFMRRRETVVVEHEEKAVLITKGAPEEVFKVCSKVHGKRGHFSDELVHAAEQTYKRMSQEGFRVLAIATRQMDKQLTYEVEDEVSLTFVGLLAFMDPPKTTVAKTLKKMQEYGIKIKIVTGDNELVSQKIAREIGLPITGIMLGKEIDKLDDDQLNERAHGVNLFARVNPDQKLRIIKTLQNHGHVVGYIGDGINDAPSLKAADVGISVSNATDIAKESADLIMVRKDLDDLVQAVIEGRKTFVNTMKYLMMTLSSNFGNMFSMAGASVFLPFLPMLPTQVLLNNLLYDASQFTLPADNVDEADLKHPKKLQMGVMRKFMVTMGPVSSLFDFLTFFILFGVLHLGQQQFQTGWFMESLGTQIFVVYIIRTKLVPFVQSWPSRYLVVGTLCMVLAGWFVALHSIGDYFGFQPLGIVPIAWIVVLIISYLVLAESVKRHFFRELVSGEEIIGM